MYVRKVKRKCGVRGCKNTDSYAISISRESGNSIIICRKCLEEGMEAVDAYNNGEVILPERKTGIPPLFYEGKRKENKSAAEIMPDMKETETNPTVPDSSETESLKDAEAGEKGTEPDNAFVCEKCGRSFKSAAALKVHMKSCKENA